jgi:hypothetical protein
VLRYKNKIVIGKKRNLRERLASVAHDWYVEGHAGYKIPIKDSRQCSTGL